MGLLFHSNIGTLREHKLPLPCFLLPSGNYLIVKACSRSLASAATPVCREKHILKNNVIKINKSYGYV